MAKQIWVSNDGTQYNSQQDAEDRDLVLEVADILISAAEQHGIRLSVITANTVADVLVMTDVMRLLIERLTLNNNRLT